MRAAEGCVIGSDSQFPLRAGIDPAPANWTRQSPSAVPLDLPANKKPRQQVLLCLSLRADSA